MIKAAIDKILELSHPELVQVLGRTYSSKALNPVLEPTPNTVQCATLIGLVEMFNFGKLMFGSVFFHIQSHKKVSIVSELNGLFRQRDVFATAAIELDGFQFGKYYDLETFNVALQSYFVQTEEIAELLKIVGNVVHEATLQVNDNGYSQTITAKTGIARRGQVAIPNPVNLTPYRTFLEVNQPSGRYVFRMRGAENELPTVALFDADCGKWKLDAIETIRQWLQKEAPGIPVVG